MVMDEHIDDDDDDDDDDGVDDDELGISFDDILKQCGKKKITIFFSKIKIINTIRTTYVHIKNNQIKQ